MMSNQPTNEGENHADQDKVDTASLAETTNQTHVGNSEEAEHAAQKKVAQNMTQSWWGTIRSPESTNLIMAAATVVIAIFTGLTFCLVLDSSNDTQKLITAAETQALAAKEISGASSDFTDSAYWMEQHMDDAANAIQDSVDTTDRNTKTAIRNAQQALRNEQRPWVGLKDFRCEQCKSEIDAKGIETLTLENMVGIMENTGKTPAVRMITDAVFTTREAREPIPYYGTTVDLSNPDAIPSWPQKEKASGQGDDLFTRLGAHPEVVLPPSATRTLPLIQNTAMQRPPRASNETTLIFYVVGKIVYYSTWGGKEHMTKFCLMSVLDASFQFCPTGNTMD